MGTSVTIVDYFTYCKAVICSVVATGHILLPVKDTRTKADIPLPACTVLNLCFIRLSVTHAVRIC